MTLNGEMPFRNFAAILIIEGASSRSLRYSPAVPLKNAMRVLLSISLFGVYIARFDAALLAPTLVLVGNLGHDCLMLVTAPRTNALHFNLAYQKGDSFACAIFGRC